MSLRLLMVGNLFVRFEIAVVVGSKVILCVREVCSRLGMESILCRIKCICSCIKIM